MMLLVTLALSVVVVGADACSSPGTAEGRAAGEGGDAPESASVAYLLQGEEPEADAGGNRTVLVGAIVIFDGSSSTDDFGIVNYTWTIEDDGVHTLYGPVVNYTFWTAGNFTVSLNVTDDDGHWDT
ncbi:MAG: PKD domain-containing protein, partial [Methanobacteriota archaeon]